MKMLLNVTINETSINLDTLADLTPHSLCTFEDESCIKGLCRQTPLRFSGSDIT